MTLSATLKPTPTKVLNLTYQYDTANQLATVTESIGSISYNFTGGYVNRGNVINNDTQTFEYNAANHLDYEEQQNTANSTKHSMLLSNSQKDDVGYTGHKFDSFLLFKNCISSILSGHTDLGLSYMQARYYDPAIGRFYPNDPIGFRDVHSFNRFAYANNNPNKFVDPDGQLPNAARGRFKPLTEAIIKTFFGERQGCKI